MRALVRKYPLTSYFVLAIAISWVAVLSVIASGPIPAPPRDAERLFPYVYLAMLVGPPVAGILMTALTTGAQGLRDFRDRLFAWRVDARWYALALLTAPLVLLITCYVLSPLSDNFVPGVLAAGNDPHGPVRAVSRASFVLMSLGFGLGAGFFEELGWTGFATPALRLRLSPVRAALTIGAVWGAWHFLAVVWGSAGSFGSVPIPLFMVVALFSFLPPYRVLMTRVYERTHSLLLAVLMHASLTTSMLLLGPAIAGSDLLLYDLAFAALLWTLVAAAERGTAAHIRSHEQTAPGHVPRHRRERRASAGVH